MLLGLRDSILKLRGFDVISTVSIQEALDLFHQHLFDLVLIDVEGNGRVPVAERLCEEIKAIHPDQKIAFVCNYRVSRNSECPDEVIRSDFNPDGLMKGVQELIQ